MPRILPRSTTSPCPATVAGVYIGGIHQSVSGGQPYFTFNRRALTPSGKFIGVIEMSLLPSDFSRFYSHLLSGEGLQFALVRDDGVMLARYPPISRDVRLDEHSGFHRSIAVDPAGGFYTSVGENDNVERRVGTRRLPGFPVLRDRRHRHRPDPQRVDRRHGHASDIRRSGDAVSVPDIARGVAADAAPLCRDRPAARGGGNAAAIAKLDAIGHLTGGVAHDFNNLLTIIIGNLETAQRQLESWTDALHLKLAQRIASAMHGAERAAALTKRLLAFARQQPLNPTAIDVNRLLNGLSDFLRRALGEDVSLEIVGTGGVWPVEADPAELEAASSISPSMPAMRCPTAAN